MYDRADKTIQNSQAMSRFMCMWNTAFYFHVCNEEQKLVLSFMVNSLVLLKNLAFCRPKYSYFGLLMKQK